MGLLKTVQEAFAPMYRPAGNLIDGVNPGSWASAQNPIRPTLQLGVGLRQWDFTPGINLQFTPRGDQAISFQQLWNVSNSFDLCRLMIEKRKNDIANRAWLIRVVPKAGETKSARLKRESSNPDVAKVTQLLRYPDGVHRFAQWIRMWVEQMLVFDAPTVFPLRAMDGSLLSLRLISGSTITPLIDDHGFRPMPPSPAYQQIILGIPTANVAGQKQRLEFTAPNRKDWKPGDPSELFYHPKNPRVDSRWGFSPVEQIIVTLSIAANRQQFFRDFYTSGNVPEGLLPMPESWSAQQIKDFQKWFDSILAGNLKMKRRIIMVPDTKREPTMTKNEALTDATDDYLNRLVAFAFGESPQPLVKQVGHQSTAKEGNDQAQASGLEPDLAHIAGSINDILNAFGYDEIEFVWEDPTEIDPVKKQQNDVAYVNAGIYTRNEVRNDNGDDPRPEPEADILMITTPSGPVPLNADAAAERSQSMTPEPAPDDEQEPGKPQPGKKPAKKRAPLKLVAGDLTPRSRQAMDGAKRVLRKFLAAQKTRISTGAAEQFVALKANVPRGTLLKWDCDRLQQLQEKPAEARAALLSTLSRCFDARLPENASAEARAAQKDELPFLRKYLSASREDQERALQNLRAAGPDAPPKLRRAAKGDLAVSGAPSQTPQDQTLTDAERAALILASLQWDYPTLYSGLKPYLEMAAEEGAAQGAHQAAVNLGSDMSQILKPATDAATAGAADRAAQMVGLKADADGNLTEAPGADWAISTTAKDDVLNTIKQAISEGWSPQQLEAVLQASAVFTPDHADLIADNEITRQQALGHLCAWMESKAVLEYVWTVADLGCCALCASFSALGSVPVGYQFAPMITAPGAHPGCRCWLQATKFAED